MIQTHTWTWTWTWTLDKVKSVENLKVEDPCPAEFAVQVRVRLLRGSAGDNAHSL